MWEKRVQSAAITSTLVIVVVILLNSIILLPNLYFKKRYFTYSLSIALFTSIVAVILNKYFYNPDPPFQVSELSSMPYQMRERLEFMQQGPAGMIRWFTTLVPVLLGLFANNAIELTLYAISKEKENVALEKEKLIAENNFLKAQINPHFLFNALNNIYTLILSKSEKAPENLMRLSNMLRYMVYDCTAKFVPIQKEIEYLNQYLSLVHLKDSKGLNITSNINITNRDLMVPPLLFIPFIENAIKHSNIDDTVNGWINFSIDENGRTIKYLVENSHSVHNSSKVEHNGIGIDNIRKRLELSYPETHIIKIEKSDDKFTAFMKLSLT